MSWYLPFESVFPLVAALAHINECPPLTQRLVRVAAYGMNCALIPSASSVYRPCASGRGGRDLSASCAVAAAAAATVKRRYFIVDYVSQQVEKKDNGARTWSHYGAVIF